PQDRVPRSGEENGPLGAVVLTQGSYLGAAEIHRGRQGGSGQPVPRPRRQRDRQLDVLLQQVARGHELERGSQDALQATPARGAISVGTRASASPPKSRRPARA